MTIFKEYLISFSNDIQIYIQMHLRFSSYWCLKFMETLESQKLGFLVFLGLKGLNKIKKLKTIQNLQTYYVNYFLS